MSKEPPSPSLSDCGKLYVVATPLGNLADFSPRAVEVLNTVDEILAEDTRHFGHLARAFHITTRAQSYHDHNEARRTPEAIKALLSGKSLALVSDAGTPTISDPGYRLLQACHENKIPVCPIPGPCAAIAALSISGFETHAFSFCGFLPVKPGKRRSELCAAVERSHPTIFYESPQRITSTLEAVAEISLSTDVFVARELTKIYEEYFRGPASEATQWIAAHPKKGEFVLILRGTTRKAKKDKSADV